MKGEGKEELAREDDGIPAARQAVFEFFCREGNGRVYSPPESVCTEFSLYLFLAA